MAGEIVHVLEDNWLVEFVIAISAFLQLVKVLSPNHASWMKRNPMCPRVPISLPLEFCHVGWSA